MSSQLCSDPQVSKLSVDDWRFQQLQSAGWTEQQALFLATHHEIDLHLACDLLANGCDPRLAWEILL